MQLPVYYLLLDSNRYRVDTITKQTIFMKVGIIVRVPKQKVCLFVPK